MNKLEKPVKGKNIKYLLDAFFNKYIRKHFNEVNSIDFIISDLGEEMKDGGRNIKILRNDNPVRTNNPDWFPPKPQQTDHICTFLKQLMDNELGTKDSYVGLKAEVVTETETYIWDVKAVDYYADSGTVILKTDPRQGISIQCPAIIRLYIYPLLTSKAVSSIIYNSIVTSNSKYNFILGERNIHKGKDNVWIFGKNNISGETNHNSLINGYNNDVDSYGNIVIGDSNKHRSLFGATIGRYIKNFKQNSFLFGTGHDNTNGPSHEAVFGKYSKIEEDTAFAIGDGEDENNRHNLFEVKYGGAILDKDGNDLRNSGGQQVQSDWNETNNAKPAYIKNKPTIPTEQVNADWNATKGKAQILNKPYVSDNNNHYGINDNFKKGDIVCNLTVYTNISYFPELLIKEGVIDTVVYESNRWKRTRLYDVVALVKPSNDSLVDNFLIYISMLDIDRDNVNKLTMYTYSSNSVYFLSKPRLTIEGNNDLGNRCDNPISLYCKNIYPNTSVINKEIYRAIILYWLEYVQSLNTFPDVSMWEFKSLVFKFHTTACDLGTAYYEDGNYNVGLKNENDDIVYLLRGNSINGNIYFVRDGSPSKVDVVIRIKFIGVVPITSGQQTRDVLRTSIVSFEILLRIDFKNFNVTSEEFANFKELQVLTNNL